MLEVRHIVGGGNGRKRVQASFRVGQVVSSLLPRSGEIPS